MDALVAKVAASLSFSEAQARLAVDAVLLAISSGATLRGFGTFALRAGRLTFRQARGDK